LTVERGAVAPDDLRARLDRLERVVEDRYREHREAIERVEARLTARARSTPAALPNCALSSSANAARSARRCATR
jgi:hypothetical protein